MDTITCLLPGGYVDENGALHCEAKIASLSGKEEEMLAIGQRSNAASLVTSILGRCIHQIGSISPVTEKVARNLLIADRQYLLLKLREATFGERVQATIVCTNQECANRMDIDFSINDVPVTESTEKGPVYEMKLSPEAAPLDATGRAYTQVSFRLPNGEDQELITPVLARDEARASQMLLERCVQKIGANGLLDEVGISQLSPLARMEIERQMEAIAPQIELTMEGECPECGHEFAVPFDLERFFINELRTSLDLLYREVHYLAYHYHWSEREIMEMSRLKRRRYIQVLADEIERLNGPVKSSL
jgi:hypothetical protein